MLKMVSRKQLKSKVRMMMPAISGTILLISIFGGALMGSTRIMCIGFIQFLIMTFGFIGNMLNRSKISVKDISDYAGKRGEREYKSGNYFLALVYGVSLPIIYIGCLLILSMLIVLW